MGLPIVAVIGASGQQGSSVVNQLSQHCTSKYAVRAIVRNPSKYSPPSPSIEVVPGDYTSVSTILPAIAGASFVFAYTYPDFTFQGLEAEWGRNIGDAVRATPSVQLLIFSSIPDAPAISEGTLRCYSYEGKAIAQKYLAGLGIPGVVFVWPGFFLENFVTLEPPDTDAEGVTVFASPLREDVLVPFVDLAMDMGRLVVAILEEPQKYVGQSVKLPGEWMTFPSLTRRWSAVTGKRSRYQRLGYEEYGDKSAAYGQDFKEMMMDMYKYLNRYGYYGGEIEDSINLPFQPGSWEDFIHRHWGTATPSTLSTPTLPTNPATRALEAYFNCFSPSNTGPVEQLFALFDDNAVVEFPYAPSDRPSRLPGLQAIKDYYKDWRSVFEFHRWFGASLHPVITSSGSSDEHNHGGEGTTMAFGEVECEGVIKITGANYRQKYIAVCEVGNDGKMLRYREYWDPTPMNILGDWNLQQK